MGTAFGLLLLLTLIIFVVGRLTRALGGQPAPDARDKALAAVVAVSALFGAEGGGSSPSGKGGSATPGSATDRSDGEGGP